MSTNLTLSNNRPVQWKDLPPEMVEAVIKNNSLAEISAVAQTAKDESRVVKEMFTAEEIVKLKESLAASKMEKATLEKEAWNDKKWRWFIIISIFIWVGLGIAIPIFFFPSITGSALAVPYGFAWALLFWIGVFYYLAILADEKRGIKRRASLEQINKLIQENTEKLMKSLI